MNIYLVQRTDEIGWDEYDEIVVLAETEEDARNIRPEQDKWNLDSWVENINTLTITLIGVANPLFKHTIVCASFKAG